LKAAPGVEPGQDPLATDLGLYDFYTTHILTYCAGYYDSEGNRNTTMCTMTTVPFAFDLGAVLLRDLAAQDFGQTDIDWPIAVIADFAWIATTTKFMSVLAVLNIVVMGISVLVDGIMFTRTDLNYPYITRFFYLVGFHCNRTTKRSTSLIREIIGKSFDNDYNIITGDISRYRLRTSS
jgi:hypothetical protein